MVTRAHAPRLDWSIVTRAHAVKPHTVKPLGNFFSASSLLTDGTTWERERGPLLAHHRDQSRDGVLNEVLNEPGRKGFSQRSGRVARIGCVGRGPRRAV
jgi:hypothetical protein